MPLGHLDEQFVAELMTQAVVQVFEIVEVEPQDRVRVARAAFGIGDRLGEPVHEQHPVGQAGEAVEKRLVA